MTKDETALINNASEKVISTPIAFKIKRFSSELTMRARISQDSAK